MGARRTAAIAFYLVSDLADRLAAAGVSGEAAPCLEEAVAVVWPLARRLAKLEKAGKQAGKKARRAREAVLGSAVARWAPLALRWVEFDPALWHVALVPGPALEREREAA